MRNIFRKFVVISLTILMLLWMVVPAMAAPTVTFSLSETTFSPNGDGFRDVTTVTFNLSSNASVSIRILQGTTVVATLHSNAALAAGPHAFIWGGTTNLTSGPVLPDGRYTILIQANDGSGTGEVAGDFYILSHLITSGMIENGSITRDKLAFGAIDGARIAEHSIGMDQLASITVLSGNIGDGSVTEPKIAADAVTTPKIADGAVTTPKLADGAVTGAKIANGTVGQTQINSVGLDADTLDGKHAAAFDSADASETTARIAADAADVTTDDATYVNDNANEVDNADIADGSLAAAKIFGTAWTANNDGPGTGLDADFLDGLDSSAFQAAGTYIVDNNNQVDNADIVDGSLAAAKIFGTAWTANNDGPGTGLDADTLDGKHAAAFDSADADLWAALGNATATIGANLTSISNQHVSDVTTLISLITTESVNRQAADADRLNSSAFGSNVRIISGDTTVSTSAVSDITKTISFGGAFTSPPSIVMINLSALSDLGARVVNLRSRPTATDSGEIGLYVEADGSGTDTAYLRWIAIGN